jgi:hypothetical protein
MPPTWDTQVAWAASTGTSTTQALTLDAATTVLYIGQCGDGGYPVAIDSITYNGTSVSTTAVFEAATQQPIRVWRLTSPDTGSSYNIVISWTGSFAGDFFAFGIKDADTTDPDDTSATDAAASGTSFSTVVTSATDDLAVCVTNVNGPPSEISVAGSDGTERLENGYASQMMQMQSAVGAASVTFAGAWSGAQRFESIGWNVNAAASGTTLGGLVGSNTGLVG